LGRHIIVNRGALGHRLQVDDYVTTARAGTSPLPAALVRSCQEIGDCHKRHRRSFVESASICGARLTVPNFSTASEGAFLGIGAIVRDHVEIGAHSVVGAGSVVIKSVPERVMFLEIPPGSSNAISKACSMA
jgi:carbonic anhydrase/acetyltransferase-like protein (isoleucine patch superfamily)